MIKTQALEYEYPDGTRALKNINIDLNKGNVIGIIGANGSGKSTLFLNLLGMLKPTGGEVKYRGETLKYNKKSLRQYREKVSIVFQDAEKQIFYSKVYDDVAFALRNLKLEEDEIQRRVNQALSKTKALDLKEKAVHFLSYGQKKRVAMAGVLVMETEIILLDEPTAGLDPYMTRQIKTIVEDLREEKKLVISSHDMDFIYETCDYIYVLSQGSIIGEGSPKEIFLNTKLIEDSLLEKPWLVKIHENLNMPLYRNEKTMIKERKCE